MIQDIIIYLFVLNSFLAALCVISSKNPVHSVLNLVFVFLNTSALLLILNVDFLAMIFLIVYVGAIAVLFLFIVMILNIKTIEFSVNLIRYLPVGILIGLIFYIQIYYILSKNVSNNNLSDDFIYSNWIEQISSITNIESLGQLLYTEYFYLFILASLVLLVAMIAAIILTVRHGINVKRQDILDQVSRKTTHIVNYK